MLGSEASRGVYMLQLFPYCLLQLHYLIIMVALSVHCSQIASTHLDQLVSILHDNVMRMSVPS